MVAHGLALAHRSVYRHPPGRGRGCTGVGVWVQGRGTACLRAWPRVRVHGPVPLSVEMWTSVVELGDALTREQKLEKRMYRLAIEQVFTDEQWSAILAREFYRRSRSMGR